MYRYHICTDMIHVSILSPGVPERLQLGSCTQAWPNWSFKPRSEIRLETHRTDGKMMIVGIWWFEYIWILECWNSFWNLVIFNMQMSTCVYHVFRFPRRLWESMRPTTMSQMIDGLPSADGENGQNYHLCTRLGPMLDQVGWELQYLVLVGNICA